ncbi:MAG: cation transporter [Francisellaceae bacterium]|jgi:cation diffusion facilitator family transporter|nr:cation transporter [Francisellaceae bacterium]MBT6539133.1 cation transporter [Francisellaceae bacterium]
MEDTQKIKQVALLSIAFSVIVLLLKFMAYWYTGSVSVLSDALESFVNVASTSLSYAIIIVAKAPADKNHPYGHDKAEYFASGGEGVLIVLAAVTIFAYSIEKLLHGYELASINSGILIAVFAALINAIIAKILLKTSNKYKSIALEANARHIITDIWTTVVVVTGLVIIKFFPTLSWIDPILALLLSLFIFYTGAKLIKSSVDGLMDISLPNDEILTITSIIQEAIPNDCCIESMRTKYQGSKRFVDFKLIVSGEMSVKNSHAICDLVEEAINKIFPGSITIIHVEPRK